MDYLSTHGHLLEQRDLIQAEAELEASIDSSPQVEFPPQCGQCKHFKFKDLVGDDGWGWCRIWRVPSYGNGCDDYQDRHMSHDACPLFEMDIPF
ncbi:hypothetical protein [Phormidesmis sp. 146-33]